MNEIEPTAEAWMDAVRVECPILPPISVATVALQRALLEIKINEQKLADCKQELADFRQEVSDAVEQVPTKDWDVHPILWRFLIPKPKPDPLVEAMADCGVDRFESWADQLRAALEARGFEIREKANDQ